MTPEQREILIQRESEKARQHLAQADEMLTLGHWDLAAKSEPTHEFIDTILELLY